MIIPKLTAESLFLVTQLIFIGSFLSIFFFYYVTGIEKDTFKSQIELIVDKVYSDIVPKRQGPGPNDEINRKIKENNDAIISKTKNMVYVALALLVSLYAIFYFMGYCIPLKTFILSNLIILVFIGLTEFTVLQLIGRRYISVNPLSIEKKFFEEISKP